MCIVIEYLEWNGQQQDKYTVYFTSYIMTFIMHQDLTFLYQGIRSCINFNLRMSITEAYEQINGDISITKVSKLRNIGVWKKYHIDS